MVERIRRSELADRVTTWPELETSEIIAEKIEGNFVADILPKFKQRIKGGASLGHLTSEVRDLIKNGFVILPNPSRVNPIIDMDGRKIGHAGLGIDIYQDMVIEPVDPSWSVNLFYIEDGERIYFPEAQYLGAKGLYTIPGTFSRHDIELQSWRFPASKGYQLEGVYAEFIPPPEDH